MIQRKQSIWFLVSAIIAALAFEIPFGFKNTTSLTSYDIHVHDFSAMSSKVLLFAFVAIILLNLISIFLFKKRNLQVLLSIISMLFSVGVMGYEIYFSTMDGNSITFGLANSVLYIGLILPLLSLILTYLAMRGVQQDVKLLKETDRLR